jgi:hypothetical protein
MHINSLNYLTLNKAVKLLKSFSFLLQQQ